MIHYFRYSRGRVIDFICKYNKELSYDLAERIYHKLNGKIQGHNDKIEAKKSQKRLESIIEMVKQPNKL